MPQQKKIEVPYLHRNALPATMDRSSAAGSILRTPRGWRKCLHLPSRSQEIPENATTIVTIVTSSATNGPLNPSRKQIWPTYQNISSQLSGLIRQNKKPKASPDKKPIINAATNLSRILCFKRSLVTSVKVLHHHRNSLPATDARCRQPILLLSPAQLVQQCNHQPRPGRTQRMPESNGAAVHVHFFPIES
jgi:hypothetical protein